MKEISVLRNYSEFPALRHCNISEKSGEDFYHTVLNNAFVEAYKTSDTLKVDLDGTAGYASSFLDEAFGNLVYDFTLEVVKKYLIIISEQEPHWKEMIEKETFLQWESRRKDQKRPIVTKLHNSWYRLINNELKQEVWEQPVPVV